MSKMTANHEKRLYDEQQNIGEKIFLKNGKMRLSVNGTISEINHTIKDGRISFHYMLDLEGVEVPMLAERGAFGFIGRIARGRQ